MNYLNDEHKLIPLKDYEEWEELDPDAILCDKNGYIVGVFITNDHYKIYTYVDGLSMVADKNGYLSKPIKDPSRELFHVVKK